jgi:hypothetical protein
METSPGLTYQGRPRTCGFRLSVTDVIVLIAGGVVGAAGYKLTEGFSLFVPFVVLHFFLFCNVFRIRRKPELVWGGIFLLNSAAWIFSGNFNILAICGSQLIVTVIVIANELRLPTYHGIFSRQINPRINDYLAGNI